MASVLIIEDEKLVRRALSRMLQAGGHDVTGVENGQKALSHFEHHPVDVVVTDIIMPVKDGLETIPELRRKYPTAKIIAISGAARPSGPDALNSAKALGANGILAKPFRQGELLLMVDELLRSG